MTFSLVLIDKDYMFSSSALVKVDGIIKSSVPAFC